MGDWADEEAYEYMVWGVCEAPGGGGVFRSAAPTPLLTLPGVLGAGGGALDRVGPACAFMRAFICRPIKY